MANTTRTFYTADLHLCHRTMARFEQGMNVPWKVPADVTERDQTIIANWNATVGKRDTVWILGDVAYASEADFIHLMRQLNGQKRIVAGNHDKTWLRKLGETHKGSITCVCDYAKVTDKGRKVILSHYPIAFWEGQHKGAYHLYGHVHGTPEEALFQDFGRNLVKTGTFPEFRAVNVGTMLWGYRPVTLDEIVVARDFRKDATFS